MSLTISPADIRAWSIMGTRGTFGVTLLRLAAEKPDIVALTADLAITSGLERFSNTYPERFFNLGIAEQNLIGVSAGIASQHMVPFATTFANFAALRACEQMRHYMGYMQENIKVVGLASGFAMGMFGTTHYGIEDVAAIRSISNITILSPADCTATAKMTLAAYEHQGPVYLRLTGNMRAPIVYKSDFELTIGRAITLRPGLDVCIVATGSMVNVAMQAAAQLAQANIDAAVLDMHTLKPLDEETLENYLGHKLIVTIEEHSEIGGLGSAVAEYLAAKARKPRQMIMGIPQGYPHAGDYGWMLAQAGLTADCLVERVTSALE